MSQNSTQEQDSSAENTKLNICAPENILKIIKGDRKSYDHPEMPGAIENLEKALISDVSIDELEHMDLGQTKTLVFAMALQVDAMKDVLSGVLDREMQAIRDFDALYASAAGSEVGLRALDLERMRAQQALQRENRLLKETLVTLVQELGLDEDKFIKRLFHT